MIRQKPQIKIFEEYNNRIKTFKQIISTKSINQLKIVPWEVGSTYTKKSTYKLYVNILSKIKSRIEHDEG